MMHKLPSEDVACPWLPCSAAPGEPCHTPNGALAKTSHLPRVLLSAVGQPSAGAVARVQKILEDQQARQAAAKKEEK